MNKKVSEYSLILVLALFICILLVSLCVNRESGNVSISETVDSRKNSHDDTIIDGKININTADVETLTMLNGIGSETAKQIVIYRKNHGPYHSVNDLMNIKGIGITTLNKIRNYITTGG